MNLPLEKEKRYTYTDYLQWDDEVRHELMDGVAVALASPVLNHQRILRELSYFLTSFLKGKSCELFVAPSAVKLTDDIVLEPDLFVVCDRKKLDGRACNGAPDLVVEIISPSTASYDCIDKFQKYLHAKVREYWIFHPDSKTVNAFVLDGDKYIGSAFGENDKLPSTVLEGFVVDLAEVFEVMVGNEQ
ncbi:MAG: Uma2 family endonuclease [Candidatus Cloacimonetes bacterium]|nr:Uma2 family endonuclease [Candidatus Cloacimonadota bacterium]